MGEPYPSLRFKPPLRTRTRDQRGNRPRLGTGTVPLCPKRLLRRQIPVKGARPARSNPALSGQPRSSRSVSSRSRTRCSCQPARSTRRWYASPALPPAIAASSVPIAIRIRAITPPVVTSPSSIGIRGSSSAANRLYSSPATAPRIARASDCEDAPDPDRPALGGRHRTATCGPRRSRPCEVRDNSNRKQCDAAREPDRLAL